MQLGFRLRCLALVVIIFLLYIDRKTLVDVTPEQVEQIVLILLEMLDSTK